jgi:hypothetical protein
VFVIVFGFAFAFVFAFELAIAFVLVFALRTNSPTLSPPVPYGSRALTPRTRLVDLSHRPSPGPGVDFDTLHVRALSTRALPE